MKRSTPAVMRWSIAYVMTGRPPTGRNARAAVREGTQGGSQPGTQYKGCLQRTSSQYSLDKVAPLK